MTKTANCGTFTLAFLAACSGPEVNNGQVVAEIGETTNVTHQVTPVSHSIDIAIRGMR